MAPIKARISGNSRVRNETVQAPDDLMAHIRNLSPTLSPGQRAIVDFFVAQCDRAVFLTSTQVAEEVSVSEATVVRTARALGFDGYPEFRAAFRDYFVERMSTVTRVRLAASPGRTESGVVGEVLQTDLRNLEMTRDRLDHAAVGRAAELIGNAETVYIIGLRSAFALASLLQFSLTLITINARLITLGLGDVPEQLEKIGPRDVVIGISFARYTRATVELFRSCLSKGARGIALTDKPTSPLVEKAEVVLEAQTRLSSFIDSFVAPVSLINVLLTLIAVKRQRKVLAALEHREEEWRRNQTYIGE